MSNITFFLAVADERVSAEDIELCGTVTEQLYGVPADKLKKWLLETAPLDVTVNVVFDTETEDFTVTGITLV